MSETQDTGFFASFSGLPANLFQTPARAARSRQISIHVRAITNAFILVAGVGPVHEGRLRSARAELGHRQRVQLPRFECQLPEPASQPGASEHVQRQRAKHQLAVTLFGGGTRDQEKTSAVDPKP